MFTLAISFNGPCRSVAETSYPSPKYWGSDGEEQPHIQGQGRWPSGTTTHLKSGEAAERSNPIAKEQRLCRHRRAERTYSTSKVRRRGHEEIPLSKEKSSSWALLE